MPRKILLLWSDRLMGMWNKLSRKVWKREDVESKLEFTN